MINSDADESASAEQARIVSEALETAVARALDSHKRAGNPVAKMQDGKVLWVSTATLRSSDTSYTLGQEQAESAAEQAPPTDAALRRR